MQYQKEEVRSRILAAALDEFEQHGYLGAQVRRIAERAGVSTGNLYRYFASKDDIFDTIVRASYERIAALMTDAVSFCSDSQVRGIRSLARHLALGIMAVYATHGRQLAIIHEKSVGSRHEDFLQTVTAMIHERMRIELARDGIVADDTLLSLIAAGFFSGMVVLLRTVDEPVRLQELISRMLVFFFDDLERRLMEPQ
ncbi:MAG: HTH-type transcriptional regulator RutR [Firmicutes bacterium]|nr:HTH-type transcriptional regulator RutR [candidate division NPL-UPA2 bacterium]